MSSLPRYAVRGAEILVRSGLDLADAGASDGAWKLLRCDAAFDSAGRIGDTPQVATDTFELPRSRGLYGGKAGGGLVYAFAKDAPAPEGWEWRPLRQAVMALPEEAWQPAARAMAYANWRAATRFCGRCGAPNEDKPDEPARRCSSCGALSFPRISPAVLAVVRRDGKILLARNALNTTGVWSILAGFVDPGETFEDCVRREVKEEVGIEIEATGYAGSQSWPFPDQLMVGFEARWLSGELDPDGGEIAEAGWFGPEDHPPLPGKGSLSRRLIDRAFEDIARAKA